MKRVFPFTLSLVFVVAIAGTVRAEGTLDKVKRTDVLVAGVTEDLPPFGFKDKDSGKILGYDVDLLTAIAQRLNVKLELRPVTETNRLAELIDGRIDILAANLTHSKSHTREVVIDFSAHYLATGQKFLAKRGVLKTLDDLVGRKVGVIGGSLSEICARDRCVGATIVTYDSFESAIQALRDGEIAAFSTDQVILLDILANLPKGEFEIPDLQISEELFHLGVRKGDKPFLDFVNKALLEIQESGEKTKFTEKWLQPRTALIPAAYGAILRKAANRSRFVAVLLNGTILPNAGISIFGLDGTYVGKGKIAGVYSDALYLDVDEAQTDFVQPGFMVTMGMSNEAARDLVLRHQDLLKSVKAESEKEAERIKAEFDREAADKAKADELEFLQREQFRQRNRELDMYYRLYRDRGYYILR